MKRLVRNYRLYFAEVLLSWAFDLLPDDSKEKDYLARALQYYGQNVFAELKGK